MLLCQRALWACAFWLGCGTPPAPAPAPAPATAPVVASAPATASAPASEPTPPAPPPRDPCAVAPIQASMLAVRDAGFPGSIPPPRGAVQVVEDNPAGPGSRALRVGSGKKNAKGKYPQTTTIRYSLPNGVLLPVKTEQTLNIERSTGLCAVGEIDGWSMRDETGLIVRLDAGGCAPAWPKEVVAGITLEPEEKQCGPRRTNPNERACALKLTWDGGSASLAPGDEQMVTTSEGSFRVLAGLCSFLDKPEKGSGKRRAESPYRMSYAIVRAESLSN